jgi:hypothetical protein
MRASRTAALAATWCAIGACVQKTSEVGDPAGDGAGADAGGEASADAGAPAADRLALRLGLHWSSGALREAPDAFQVGAAVADSVRTSLSWWDVQGSPLGSPIGSCERIDGGVFDWSLADRDMLAFAEAGAERVMTLGGVPDCADKDREGIPDAGLSVQPKEIYEEAYLSFVARVVERYGPGGDFWAEHPELPCCAVTAFEFWNEPNYADNWHIRQGDPEPERARDYGRMFRRVATTIHGAARGPVRVMTGGISNLDENGNGRGFLRDLYEAHPDIGQHMDVMGIHTYSSGPDAAMSAVRAVRTIMANHGDGEVPIAITEHGWSTCPDPEPGQYSGKCVVGGEAQQASFLTEFATRLDGARDELEVELLVWFNIQDTADPVLHPECSTPGNFYGLFRFDGTAKSSLAAWRELTGAALAPGTTLPAYPKDRGCKLGEQG